jgi:fumarate reductase flavoprotein subunit
MHKTLLSLALGCLVSTLALAQANEPSKFLGDRHVAKGMNCQTCHIENSKELKNDGAKHEICVQCHGFYDKVAEKTKPSNPEEGNPHGQHDGNLPCTECHKGHKPGVNYCGQCHGYNFKVP